MTCSASLIEIAAQALLRDGGAGPNFYQDFDNHFFVLDVTTALVMAPAYAGAAMLLTMV